MAWKQTRTLGRQAIPNFARYATLCEGSRDFTDGNGVNQWPEANSIYGAVAALGFFRRGGIFQDSAVGTSLFGQISQPLSVSYWSSDPAGQGGWHRFGLDAVAVPAPAEWFSVAWLAPPTDHIGNDEDHLFFPYPEDFFRIAWSLSI